MTTKQAGAAYNHSCLKVPVNPTNRLPLPTFERKVIMPNTYENRHKVYSRKGACDDYTIIHCSDRFSSAGSREMSSKTLTSQNNVNELVDNSVKESVKSFLHFYESIPDYGDVNHLSDREFYIKLQDLKEKQKSYLRGLDEKDFHERIYEKKNTRQGEIKDSKTTGHKYYKTDLNLQGKKCDINNKTHFKTSVYQEKMKKYADCYDSPSYWNKFDNKYYISPSPTMSAVSLDGVRKNRPTPGINPKPSIQINNYLLNSTELDNKTRSNIRKTKHSAVSIDKENCLKTNINQQEPHKIKTNELYNDSKKIRDTHSASMNKAEDSSTLNVWFMKSL